MTRSATLLVLPIALAGCFVTAPPAQNTQPATVETRDHRGADEGPPGGGGGGVVGVEAAEPIDCHGNESVVLESCVIESADVAVNAHGNCSVVLTDCEIRAGRLAIDAHGNASVVIRGGLVDAPMAIDAHGNASVVIEGASVNGDVDRHGNASVTGI